MKSTPLALALLVLEATAKLRPRASTASTACPLLGQQYPAPTGLSAEPKFQAVTKQLDAVLNQDLDAEPLNSSTFSIGFFSTSEDDLVYQYHNTAPAVANSKYGGNTVDADSIYRIGSISKLFTVYLWLIAYGDGHFNDPIGKILPQLLKDSSTSWNSVTPDWNSITIGDLMGQMSGLVRDFGLGDFAPPDNALAGTSTLPQSLLKAFPKLPEQQVPQCGYLTPNYTFIQCTLDEYLEGLATESPIFPTAYTPVYSNEGFALVGSALATLAGTSLESLFDESFVEPLGLTGTYYTVPESITEHSVIPGTPLSTGWNSELGIFGAAGGYFSTVNDFATIGRAILTSQLIPQSTTDRWFKPSGFVEDWSQGVGRPWEIFRFKVNGQTIDVYSKGGDYGAYDTWYALVPAYNFGMTIFTSGNEAARGDLPNILVDAVLPVLDEIAQDQAASNFAGTYESEQSNSSVTISTGGLNTGLRVTAWTSQGVNLLNELTALFGDFVWRIVPNQLHVGNGKVSFTSYYAVPEGPPVNGTFFWTCPGWVDVDEITYGNVPLGQMEFDVDSGKATTVNVRALRQTLTRQS